MVLTHTTPPEVFGAGSRFSSHRSDPVPAAIPGRPPFTAEEEALRLPLEERMALVLRLGERGLEMFRQANGLDRETAVRELQRQRQAGRTPSKCMSELIG